MVSGVEPFPKALHQIADLRGCSTPPSSHACVPAGPGASSCIFQDRYLVTGVWIVGQDGGLRIPNLATLANREEGLNSISGFGIVWLFETASVQNVFTA